MDHSGTSPGTSHDAAPGTSTEDRLTALAARVADLETRLAELDARASRSADELAVLHLVAAYAPAVDAGLAEEVAALWAPGGVYDVDTGVLDGRTAVADMVAGAEHRGLITRGCAHLPGLPRVEIDGGRAVATGHTLLVVRSSTPGRYSVVRATANRWELARTEPTDGDPHRGWRVTRRTARVLDADGSGRAVLARADR